MQYKDEIWEYADAQAISPYLLAAIIKIESDFDPHVMSLAGAVGLCQFMPGTARDMGLRVDKEVDERENPDKSIEAGAKYLRWLYDSEIIRRYAKDSDHTLALVLAAYNAGIGRVEQYGGIPPFKETLNYIHKVLWQKFQYEEEAEADAICQRTRCPLGNCG